MKIHPIDRKTLALAMLILAVYLAPASPIQAQNASESDAAAREYAAATGLLNRGLNEMAVTEYCKFLAAHPSHEQAASARYGLGVALFRLQKFDEADVELRPLSGTTGFAFAAETLLIRGQCLLSLQKPAEAVKAFEQFLAEHSEHAKAADAAALLAESQYRAGQHKSVAATCELLTNRWPQNPLRERAEYFNGLAAFALEDFARAAQLLESHQQSHPKSQFADQIALLLAQAWHRGGDLDRAARQYEQAIKQQKGDAAADAMYGLGTLLQSQSKSEQAGRVLDRLLEQFPEHRLASAARLQRGRTYFDAKKYDEARSAFEKAAADGAAADETAYWIAKCHMRQNDFPAVVSLLDRAITQTPRSKLLAEMTYDRAVALIRSNDLDAALSALSKFRRDFPTHSLAPDALLMQATIEHGRREYMNARRLCSEFESQYPDHSLSPAVCLLGADCDLLSGQLEKAIAGFRNFLAQYPDNSQVPTARFRLGTALYSAGLLDDSRTELAALVNGKKTPEPFRRALLILGDISFQREQWQDAVGPLSDFLSFGANQSGADDALLKSSIAQIRMDRPDEALTLLERLLQEHPQSVHRAQAMFERGQILLGRKTLDQAAQSFQSLLGESPDSRFAPHALNHLAFIAMQREQFDRAAELYAQTAQAAKGTDLAPHALFQQGQALMAAKQYQPAAELFSQFVKQHRSHELTPRARAQQALALTRNGSHAEALKVMAVIQRQDSQTLDAKLLATLKYEQAWCLRELSRLDEASDVYRDLLSSFPDAPLAANAMLELAELATAAKRHAEAEQLLSQLHQRLQHKGTDALPDLKEQAIYRLAACKYELGHLEESATLFEEFIQNHARSALLPSALLMCAESYYKSQRLAKAAPHYAALIEKYPADPMAATSMLRLGECLAAAEQWEQSQKTFAAFLSKYPEHDFRFQAQFGLAWALENQSQYDKAIAAYRTLVDHHQGQTAARAQFQIGECHFAARKFDDAVRELLKVDILYQHPEWSAAALYEAGRCFEELAKPAEARTQFEQVRDRFPRSRWADLAAQRLTAMAAATSP